MQRLSFSKVIRYFLLTTLALVVLLSILIMLFGLSAQSNLPPRKPLTQENITQARKILFEGTKIRPDDISAITLSEADLNLAGNYLLNRYHHSEIYIELVNYKVRCNIALRLPWNFFGHYFNASIRFGVKPGEILPQITKFKIGDLLLPTIFADWGMRSLIRFSSLSDYFILATKPIQRVDIDRKTLTIYYEATAASSYYVNEEMRRVYQQKIAEIIAQHDPKWRLSLADLLKPVFDLAYRRSNAQTAIEENRSAIIAINDYVNALVNPPYAAFLYKRTDLAKHFMGAAALSVSINRLFANALGEVKELRDAQTGGSGFSFVDLAADKAGSRFGEVAVSSLQSARSLQALTAQIQNYSDFMPDPRDLPEHMNEEEFKRNFISMQSMPYLALVAQIDARIANIPLYQVQ